MRQRSYFLNKGHVLHEVRSCHTTWQSSRPFSHLCWTCWMEGFHCVLNLVSSTCSACGLSHPSLRLSSLVYTEINTVWLSRRREVKYKGFPVAFVRKKLEPWGSLSQTLQVRCVLFEDFDRVCWSSFQLQKQGDTWTITSLAQRKQPFTAPEVLRLASFAGFWTVGGSWRTQREPTQTQSDHANMQSAHRKVSGVESDPQSVCWCQPPTRPHTKTKPLFIDCNYILLRTCKVF